MWVPQRYFYCHLRLIIGRPLGQKDAALRPCCLQSLALPLHDAQSRQPYGGADFQGLLVAPKLRRPEVRLC
jgi:hypothetical protein